MTRASCHVVFLLSGESCPVRHTTRPSSKSRTRFKYRACWSTNGRDGAKKRTLESDTSANRFAATKAAITVFPSPVLKTIIVL